MTTAAVAAAAAAVTAGAAVVGMLAAPRPAAAQRVVEPGRALAVPAYVELPRDVERAIYRQYPRARIAVEGTRSSNGVRIYDLRVDTLGRGVVGASVTEAGDYVVLEHPGVTWATLPAPIRALLVDLFPAQATRVSKASRTYYLLDVDTGGRRDVRVRLDAVGRLRDIKSAAEVRQEDLTKLTRASGSEQETLRKALEAYFIRPRIRDARRHAVQGFFWVDLTTALDEEVRVLVGLRGELAQVETQVDLARLPPWTVAEVKQTFREARVRAATRRESIFYQVDQALSRRETLTLSISPLGDVAGVSTTVEEEPARIPPERPREVERDPRVTPRDPRDPRDFFRDGR